MLDFRSPTNSLFSPHSRTLKSCNTFPQIWTFSKTPQNLPKIDMIAYKRTKPNWAEKVRKINARGKDNPTQKKSNHGFRWPRDTFATEYHVWGSKISSDWVLCPIVCFHIYRA